jgi:hypothetical protein
MRKHGAFQDNSMKKYYILTRPSKLSDLAFDDMDEDTDIEWKEKSRQLQLRRWRKIRHQLA